ncbi:ComEC/Rec2 family competence protein [Campylobacter sp. CS_ED1]|uniref:ComEC/Rec2 family competence protein n=1 Tax=Campylobacter sp. CS_ED1 TaxID=2984140 RepID=UPI0022E9F268|nr:ComEC/Rec2 family competence protein [Campylobacter sp. CS_ED1]MDA3085885.1 ComEC/Rec2 family competence protein [Campylobacter sp. CS_ED1]
MKKLEIFENKWEILLFLLFALSVFILNLGFCYKDFYEFKSQKYRFYNAQILQNYEKTNAKGRTYRVLRLKTSEFEFYTTTKKDFEFANAKTLNIGVITQNVKFIDFVKKRFYMPSFKLKPKFENSINSEQNSTQSLQNSPNFKNKFANLKQNAINFITSQHKNSKMQELYSALYFATPISRELRANVTNWGIAHIIAISGFHLGIIFGICFFIFKPAYKFFQKRYFPYRSVNFDISIFVFILMSFYLLVLDFTPSFLRSLAMAFVGFFLLMRNFKIINFATLFITIAFLIALFPHLAFSIGFYFSCMGVLFIFIYVKHFKDKFGLFAHLIFFNLFVWFCMNVPVYYFFSTLTPLQISVVPISYAFIIFYPLSVVLHIFGVGYIFDEYLLNFLEFSLLVYKTQIPLWLFVMANLSAILAIKFKNFALFCALLGFLPIFFIV